MWKFKNFLRNYNCVVPPMSVEVIQERFGVCLKFGNGTSIYTELSDENRPVIHLQEDPESDDMTRSITVGGFNEVIRSSS